MVFYINTLLAVGFMSGDTKKSIVYLITWIGINDMHQFLVCPSIRAPQYSVPVTVRLGWM